jgi:hypothetical protein
MYNSDLVAIVDDTVALEKRVTKLENTMAT